MTYDEPDIPDAVRRSKQAQAATRAFETGRGRVMGVHHDPHDRGGPTIQGITQTAIDEWNRLHPRESITGGVRSLTQQQIDRISEMYWSQSGADKLPEPLGRVYFDAYFQRPALARQVLAQTSDPAEFTRLWIEGRMATGQPRYHKGWRNRALQSLADATHPEVAPPEPMQPDVLNYALQNAAKIIP